MSSTEKRTTAKKSLIATALVGTIAMSSSMTHASANSLPSTDAGRISSNVETRIFPAVAAAAAALSAGGVALAWAADKLYELGKAHGRLEVARGDVKAPTSSGDLQGMLPVLD